MYAKYCNFNICKGNIIRRVYAYIIIAGGLGKKQKIMPESEG